MDGAVYQYIQSSRILAESVDSLFRPAPVRFRFRVLASDQSQDFTSDITKLLDRLKTTNDKLQSIAAEAKTRSDAKSQLSSSDFKAATSKLVNVATLIHGEFDPKKQDAKATQQIVNDISTAFSNASASAKACLDDANGAEIQFVQIRDGDILAKDGGLLSSTVSTAEQLNGALKTTNDELRARIQDLNTTQESLASQQTDLTDAINRYNDAVKRAHDEEIGEAFAWLFWPVGLLHFTVGKKFQEDVSNQQGIVNTTVSHISDVQTMISDTQGKIRTLQDSQNRCNQFQIDLSTLQSQIKQLADAAEQRRSAIQTIARRVEDVWINVKLIEDIAASCDWALTKAQYAVTILRILDTARFMPDLRDLALQILLSLSEGDDAAHTVAKIVDPTLHDGAPLLGTVTALWKAM